MPLFTDCLRISSLKALRFLLQARVLTYNEPAQGEGRKKKRGTMAGLKLLYAEMKWTRLKRKHPSPLSHEMVGRSEPADGAAVCDTGGKSLITPAARCNPVCDAEDTKIHRERAGRTRGQRPQCCPFFRFLYFSFR